MAQNGYLLAPMFFLVLVWRNMVMPMFIKWQNILFIRFNSIKIFVLIWRKMVIYWCQCFFLVLVWRNMVMPMFIFPNFRLNTNTGTHLQWWNRFKIKFMLKHTIVLVLALMMLLLKILQGEYWALEGWFVVAVID